MKKSDFSMIVILAGLALFIWFRNTQWMSSSDDTLPILVTLPLFVWLGMPWKFKEEATPPRTDLIVVATIFFLFGIVSELTIALAIGWVTLLWSWLSVRIIDEDLSSRRKLLILPIMAFPWITLDAVTLGWWFRLSAAAVTAQTMSLLGFEVLREGTFLVVNGKSISVEVACSGLNTLQSMLIAGSIVAYMMFKDSPRFWYNLPLLIVLAWVANTIRIITLTFVAVVISPEFAMGSFHTWGGWFILMLMFALCWFIFSLQEKTIPKKT